MSSVLLNINVSKPFPVRDESTTLGVIPCFVAFDILKSLNLYLSSLSTVDTSYAGGAL